MTISTPEQVDAAVAEAPRSGLARRFFSNPLGLVPSIVLAAIAVLSVASPWIAPHDPSDTILDQVNSAPNEVFLLGGDGSGRDVLSRLLLASRLTLIGAITVAIVSVVVGLVSGLLAGYLGKWIDSSLSWVNNVLMTVPSVIILVALFSVIGPNTVVTMAIFGVLISPFLFRLVRTLVIAVKNELYVDAARVSGLSGSRILGRHVLYAVRAPIIIIATGMVGAGILIQAGLEFLGLGSPSEPTWGGMLEDAFLNIFRSPLGILWPGIAIGLTAGCLSLIANALRDALEEPAPKARTKSVRLKDEALRRASAPAGTAEAPPEDALLVVSNLRVGYPQADGSARVVVDGVNLHVNKGEILGLVGESGSGKTQTAFSILRLLPEEAEFAGDVTFEGVPLLALSESEMQKIRGKRIAYIPQEPMSNLDPTFTIGHQLTVPMMRTLGLTKKEATARAKQLLERVGIADPERTFRAYPHEISGGMAQRVLIAGAVSCEPELIVADEPTTALDVTVQAEILDLLRELQKERGMAIILVTHNFGVVADLCDRVAVMQAGHIVETNTASELFDRPQHPYTRMLLSSTLEDTEPRKQRVAALTEGR
ncbi:dipeptide/oligopeptide/nickel ABC transporter permease/ATP-binding protein [Agromyces albus]|uniref:Dipeptide/oligopeptide/nickel ABC transporter permease/ATP-binding protein n=1 Tax=Agromyces albus TaxID=205332 RepID=A0A4Q2L1F6_9MICO|nr:dipeptide/oligopeptide/nickel ABC transporter permease/ATP-binding protein [Agromyces albus]RXZ71207.1 dipeptide/oligopeptide/nickel ABC transporter permease/ATP-binding protein [Agromyces albus]